MKGEWLLTNGTGGYAMGSQDGLARRAYHGWLVAALDPPLGRRLLLHRVEPVLLETGEILATALYPGGVLSPDPRRLLLDFQENPWPRWTYQTQKGLVAVTLALLPGVGAAHVQVDLLSGDEADILLRPVVSDRSHHGRLAPGTPFKVQAQDDAAWVTGPEVALRMEAPGTRFEGDPFFLEDVVLEEEVLRGYPEPDRQFVPGGFRGRIRRGSPLQFRISLEGAGALPERPESHALSLASLFPEPPTREPQSPDRVAVRSALPAFLAEGPAGPAIIAGFPWFGAWARDSFISVPGLLGTGRVELSGQILLRFLQDLEDGLFPDSLPTSGTPSIRNAADAPLHFIRAVGAYARAGGDAGPFQDGIREIIQSFTRGTAYGIGLRGDLLKVGPSALPLTWMDAVLPSGAVTPREGYPVELTALFLLALDEAAALLASDREAFLSLRHRVEGRARLAFRDLPDRLDPQGTPDPALRPNILFLGLALPDWAGRILSRVEPLLTPMGLRSLGPLELSYRGIYQGAQVERDGAYHEGTVWPFLLGPWADLVRLGGGDPGPTLQAMARRLLKEGPVPGQIPEVAGGDPPFGPGGCPAQAWSVFEIFRSLGRFEP